MTFPLIIPLELTQEDIDRSWNHRSSRLGCPIGTKLTRLGLFPESSFDVGTSEVEIYKDSRRNGSQIYILSRQIQSSVRMWIGETIGRGDYPVSGYLYLKELNGPKSEIS